RWAHTNVHAAVTGNHDEGKVIFQAVLIELAAAFTLPEHLHYARQRCSAVLEQVVDISRFVRRIRITCRNNHRATGMVKRNDIAFNALEEQLQAGEDTATWARAVTGSQTLRLLRERADRRNFDVQLAGFRIWRYRDQTGF